MDVSWSSSNMDLSEASKGFGKLKKRDREPNLLLSTKTRHLVSVHV
jgi:hypothetical protein